MKQKKSLIQVIACGLLLVTPITSLCPKDDAIKVRKFVFEAALPTAVKPKKDDRNLWQKMIDSVRSSGENALINAPAEIIKEIYRTALRYGIASLISSGAQKSNALYMYAFASSTQKKSFLLEQQVKKMKKRLEIARKDAAKLYLDGSQEYNKMVNPIEKLYEAAVNKRNAHWQSEATSKLQKTKKA